MKTLEAIALTGFLAADLALISQATSAIISKSVLRLYEVMYGEEYSKSKAKKFLRLSNEAGLLGKFTYSYGLKYAARTHLRPLPKAIKNWLGNHKPASY